MALDASIYKHLKDNLDQSSGGGLRVESESARPADIPVLVVGLGGTGVNSVLRVKRMVEERLNVRDARDIMTNIEYLVFDTDSGSKNAEYKGTKFSESDTIILEHTRLAELYDGLKSNANADRNSSNRHVVPWINPNLDVRRITDGAGGVRQAGRFLMFSTFERIETALRRKISNIVRDKRAELAKVYVFICTGISGGTGSGTFIDMPYIIRQALSENGSWEARVTGFLFLPDVNLQDVKADPATADGIRKNGFAALKELDYLMNMDRSGNGDRFKQSYTENFQVDYAIPPYDICNLVSSIDREGKQTTKRDFCMLSVAEAIVNFIADERNPNAAEGQDFSIASYWSNITGTEARARDRLGVSKLPAVYKYCAVGASSGLLPLGKVLNSVTYKFFKKMDDVFARRAGKAEVNALMEKLGLDVAGIQTAVKSGVTGLQRPAGEFEMVRIAPSKQVEENLSKQLARIKAIMENNRNDYIKKTKERLTEEFIEFFKDKDKGPFYVKDLLENTSNTALRDYLAGTFGDDKGLAEQFVEKKAKRESYNNAINAIKFSMEKLTSYNVPLNVGGNRVLDKYVSACYNYYNSMLNDAVWDYASEICYSIRDFVAKEYADMYDVYAEILSAQREIFANNFSKGDSDKNQSNFYWDLFRREEFVEKVDELIADGTINVNLDLAVAEFLKSLISEGKRDVWLGRTKKGLRVAQEMNEFICSQFRALSDASVGKYMNYMLKDTQHEEKASEIKHRLAENSQVMFPFKATIPKSEAQVKYISAPVNVMDNEELAKQFKIGETGQEVTVKGSVLTAQFFQFTVNPGIPLAAYRELELYEKVYERLFMSSDSNGVHLYKGGLDKNQRDWKTFIPSPLVEQAWSNNYVNERTKARNRQIAELFEQAQKYGYIFEDNGKYVWRTAKPVDVDRLMKEYDITIAENIEETDQVSAVAAVKLLKLALSDDSRYGMQKDFFDTLTIDTKPDMRYAIGTLAATPIFADDIRKTVEAHESVLVLIERLNKSINKDSGYYEFAMALAFGIITRERRTYKYSLTTGQSGVNVLTRLESDDEHLDFPEFYAFSSYTDLDENAKSKIKQLANDYVDDEKNDVETAIATWSTKFAEKLSSITANKDATLEFALKERFYSRSKESLDKLLKSL